MFSNIDEVWGQDYDPPIPDAKHVRRRGRAVNPLSDAATDADTSVNFSELLSPASTEIKPYAPYRAERRIPTRESKCNYTYRHLSHCDMCYRKLKTLVNDLTSKKFDERVLEMKMQKIMQEADKPTHREKESFQNTTTTPHAIMTNIYVFWLLIVIIVILMFFIILRVRK